MGPSKGPLIYPAYTLQNPRAHTQNPFKNVRDHTKSSVQSRVLISALLRVVTIFTNLRTLLIAAHEPGPRMELEWGPLMNSWVTFVVALYSSPTAKPISHC